MEKISEGGTQTKIATGLASVAIIALILSLYFTTNNYSKQVIANEGTIKNLQKRNKILLDKSKTLNSEIWKTHLNILATSIKKLRDKEVCPHVEGMLWGRIYTSYTWVVQNETSYTWDKKRINYLLSVQYLRLSHYDQSKIVNELEKRLTDAKDNVKKVNAKKEEEAKKDASVSIKYVPITA